MVSLDVVVGVGLGAMPRRREQLLQDDRVGRRLVGDHLCRRDLRGGESVLEEPSGRCCVTTRGDEHVDDLAELVDGLVDVAPLSTDLHVGLVDPPAGPDGVAARAGGVGQERREPLDPAVDGGGRPGQQLQQTRQAVQLRRSRWPQAGHRAEALRSRTTMPRLREEPRQFYSESSAQRGEYSQGCLRSKNSGTPTLSAAISSIWAFSSGGGSLRSPSRAASSEVKYNAMVSAPPSCPTPTMPVISGRQAA